MDVCASYPDGPQIFPWYAARQRNIPPVHRTMKRDNPALPQSAGYSLFPAVSSPASSPYVDAHAAAELSPWWGESNIKKLDHLSQREIPRA